MAENPGDVGDASHAHILPFREEGALLETGIRALVGDIFRVGLGLWLLTASTGDCVEIWIVVLFRMPVQELVHEAANRSGNQ